MNAAIWAALLLLSLIWGGSFLFMKMAVAVWPPLTVVLSRVVLAALGLGAALWIKRQRLPLSPALIGAWAVMAVLNNLIPFTLIVWSQKSIGVGLGAVVNATTPVLTAVIAHYATADERLSPRRIGGVLIGLFGVVVLMAPRLTGQALGELPGILAALGACMSYALATVWGRRFKRMGVAPLAAATGQVTAAALLILPVALILDRPWTLPWPDTETLGAILALGLVCTGFAYALFFRILNGAGANAAALVTQLVPASAVLIGWVALGEVPGLAQWAGMALITLGLLVLDGRMPRFRRNRR
ncbi:DMT family transporter [Acetobacteraceae bacterium H6797]|nr:DMT family transporter [Acetobacteraceae bacterium H6797]